MRRTIAAAALSVLFGWVCPARAEPAPSTPPELDQYLHAIGLGTRELETAASGRPTVKPLPTANDRDLAVFGMIGVNAAPETVLARVVDLERALAVRGRRFHVFSDPPVPSDVRQVAFADSDYRELRNCRPGHCKFKLPAAGMEMFVQQIDWSAPDAKAQVDDRLRRGVLQLAMDYRSRGNSATLPYDDVNGIRAGDVFLELVAQAPGLYGYAPALERYLKTFPAGRPKAVRDYLYWSEDRMDRLRPTLTLNHVVVYVPASASSAAIVAQKQLYASHYYEGGFDVLAIVGAGAPGGQRITYLLVMRRFRLDKLPSGVINARGKMQSHLSELTRSDLERFRSMGEPSRTRSAGR